MLLFDGYLQVDVYKVNDGKSARAARVIFGKEPSTMELYELVREHGIEPVRWAYNVALVIEKGVGVGKAGGGAGKTNPKCVQRMTAKAMRENGISTKAQEALKVDMELRGEERIPARRSEQK